MNNGEIMQKENSNLENITVPGWRVNSEEFGSNFLDLSALYDMDSRWIRKESIVHHRFASPDRCFLRVRLRNITCSYIEIPCCSAFTRPSLCSPSNIRSLCNLFHNSGRDSFDIDGFSISERGTFSFFSSSRVWSVFFLSLTIFVIFPPNW